MCQQTLLLYWISFFMSDSLLSFSSSEYPHHFRATQLEIKIGPLCNAISHQRKMTWLEQNFLFWSVSLFWLSFRKCTRWTLFSGLLSFPLPSVANPPSSAAVSSKSAVIPSFYHWWWLRCTRLRSAAVNKRSKSNPAAIPSANNTP